VADQVPRRHRRQLRRRPVLAGRRCPDWTVQPVLVGRHAPLVPRYRALGNAGLHTRPRQYSSTDTAPGDPGVRCNVDPPGVRRPCPWVPGPGARA